ncbi:hypothetical protein [Geodermatophilus sp. SYSU D01119]
MGARRDGSWQSRYEAARAKDEADNAAWVQSHFGGPVTRTLAKQLPGFVFLALVGLVTLGWQAAVVNVVLLLVVVLGFRAWARRHGARG